MSAYLSDKTTPMHVSYCWLPSRCAPGLELPNGTMIPSQFQPLQLYTAVHMCFAQKAPWEATLKNLQHALLHTADTAAAACTADTAADAASPLLHCLAGMMCALAGAGTWMLIATYLELPVSSTQSIVSSIAGM